MVEEKKQTNKQSIWKAFHPCVAPLYGKFHCSTRIFFGIFFPIHIYCMKSDFGWFRLFTDDSILFYWIAVNILKVPLLNQGYVAGLAGWMAMNSFYFVSISLIRLKGHCLSPDTDIFPHLDSGNSTKWPKHYHHHHLRHHYHACPHNSPTDSDPGWSFMGFYAGKWCWCFLGVNSNCHLSALKRKSDMFAKIYLLCEEWGEPSFSSQSPPGHFDWQSVWNVARG